MRTKARHRVLLVNQYYRPDTAATAQRLTELSEELAREHDVTVLAGRPSYGPEPAPPPVAGVVVVRVPSTAFHRSRLAGRIANYMSYLVLAALRGLVIGRVNVVVAATDPPVAGLVGWCLSRVHRVPFVWIVQDLHPEAAVRMGMLRSRRLVRALTALNRFLFRRTQRIVVLSESMRRRVIEAGAPAERLLIIPNWEDVAVVRPEPKDNPVSRRWGLHDRFVVMYSGNLGGGQELDICVRLAAELRDLTDVVVALIGDGTAKPHLEALSRELGLDTVRFLPYEPRETMRYSLGAGDVFVLPLAGGLDGFVVPSKVFTIMASGRPFVAVIEAASEVAALIERFRCGLRVDPGDLVNLAAAARWLHAHRDEARAMGTRGRDAVERLHGRDVVLPRYRQLLDEVMAG
ncbi:MAG: glycosyltransferase family 4 protein [Candidatus Rokuibacteriota bacterium]